MVITGANPDLIKEIQLTVWVAREYLTAITAAQILARARPTHNILLLLPTSDQLRLNFSDLESFEGLEYLLI